MSKKYPAAGHKNLMEDAGAAAKMHTPFHKDDEDVKEAFKQAGEDAGKAGAKAFKKSLYLVCIIFLKKIFLQFYQLNLIYLEEQQLR